MPEDFYIKIRVKTNQKKESRQKLKDGLFVISIKEKPERNLANKKILEILKEFYGISSNIKIVNGHHHPIKLINIELKK